MPTSETSEKMNCEKDTSYNLFHYGKVKEQERPRRNILSQSDIELALSQPLSEDEETALEYMSVRLYQSAAFSFSHQKRSLTCSDHAERFGQRVTYFLDKNTIFFFL